MTHWNVEQTLAAGILIWIWNRFGFSERVTLVGNIVAFLVVLFFVFFR